MTTRPLFLILYSLRETVFFSFLNNSFPMVFLSRLAPEGPGQLHSQETQGYHIFKFYLR